MFIVVSLVESLPEIAQKEIKVCPGKDVAIDCHYAISVGLLQPEDVSWFCRSAYREGLLSYHGTLLEGLNGEIYGISDNGTWSTLTLRNINSTHAGNYTCRYANGPFSTCQVFVGNFQIIFYFFLFIFSSHMTRYISIGLLR